MMAKMIPSLAFKHRTLPSSRAGFSCQGRQDETFDKQRSSQTLRTGTCSVAILYWVLDLRPIICTEQNNQFQHKQQAAALLSPTPARLLWPGERQNRPDSASAWLLLKHTWITAKLHKTQVHLYYSFSKYEYQKGYSSQQKGTILLLMKVSIQHLLIFLRFFTAELAIVSTVSMGLWEAVAAHFHHHPTHTKYVTRYLTTQAATSIICAQLSEGHCCQWMLRERSTGPALFRIPHKGRSMPSSMALGSTTGLLCFAGGVEQQQQQEEYFPFQDRNRNTVSVLFVSLRTACVRNPFITHWEELILSI